MVLKFIYGIIKRALDILLALVSIIVLAPLFILVIVILKFTGEGEIFFLQERIGKDNKPFPVYKFVTMRRKSELAGSITYKNDPRVLPFGRFLRITKINELPQLLNILKGDISLVGPRPLAEESFLQYPPEIQAQVYKNNKPGLTGIGSLFFRSEEEMLAGLGKDIKAAYREDIMPVKGELELWYKEKHSLWVDLKIICLTALAILFPSNTLHLKAFGDIKPEIIAQYKRLAAVLTD